jgi:hypothetical protein
MKAPRLLLFSLLVMVAGIVSAQTPWTTTGNSPTSNCFIGTTNPVPLVMKTDGIQRMTIDQSGKVTISNLASADTSALIVLADGSIAKASDPGGCGGDCNLLIWDGDGNAAGPDCFIGTTNPQPLRLYSNGMERMRVTTEGNVVVQGFSAKAPFQVFDHLGVTVNRQDYGVADVVRTIGFNLYQDGSSQKHYQQGTAAKMEFISATGLLQFSIAPSQQADAVVAFPAGIQLDQYGKTGIGTQPHATDALAVGGIARIQQATNPNNTVRISHNGTNAVLETNGNSLVVRNQAGMVSIDRIGSGNNFLRLGHDGTNAYMETGGGANAQLNVNAQSAKTVSFGGDVLVANRIGVGTTNFFEGNREYKFVVNGHIRAKAAHIYPAWADYVFAPDYKLMPLGEVEKYIAIHGHLPNMPSSEKVEADGIDVGEIQAKTLEKVEELTLYILEMKRENESLKAEVKALRKEVRK